MIGTALEAGRSAAGFAVPLRGAGLGELLRRNGAVVPAYGRDLNLAGVLELTATSVGAVDVRLDVVERPDVVRELDSFAGLVLGVVGDPGSGRTTELGALAARRARGAEPAPTLWLRGADLRAGDASVADAVARTLQQAGRIVAPGGLGAATPEGVARLAADAGQPLLVLLDGPEEMAPVLAHRMADWAAGTASWLRAHRVRMVVACRPEHWEQASALYPEGAADVVRIGDLTAAEAERARVRNGIPDGALAPADAAHPLALRLLAEVREALPEGAEGCPSREEIFTAHLDLMCLRIAVRIAAGAGPALRGSAVRRLAARVSGRVHEAARRCLGPGQGELDREAFEELFPWRTGWASAVLTEGLITPAGTGYRFAHEELADWIQGEHLDVDGALRALVHRWHEGKGPTDPTVRLPSRPGPSDAPVPGARDASRALPVPRHRIGPVIRALLVLGRERGPAELGRRLGELLEAVDRLAPPPAEIRLPQQTPAPERVPAPTGELHVRLDDARWWAVHLLAEVLLRLSDAEEQRAVLRRLADRIAVSGEHPGAYGLFGPGFWERVAIGDEVRLDLLRRLVPVDGVPGDEPGRDRYLDAVARRLVAAPRFVQVLLCGWFADERALPASPGADVLPTVARAAQALLYARRRLAVDDLTEALAAASHPRADELLAALAEDETPALCRAVDRWAHDDRPARRAAAAVHGLLVAPHVTTEADRELLRYAALALLGRTADTDLHGPALALLVTDPATRTRYLPRALLLLSSGRLPASAAAVALATHPDQVLAAFRARLDEPGDGAGEVLRALAEVDTPALARRAADLVREYVDRHPEGAAHAAAFVDRRFEHGPAARAVLFPLVTGMLRGHPPQVRAALAPVLAAPGSRVSRAMRAELVDVLLDHERYAGCDHTVLDALLQAAAQGSPHRSEPRTRDLVHRTGLLLVRTPEGASCFDRRLVELAEEVPGFAAQIVDWFADAPDEWAAVIGPSARRTVESLGGPMPMRAGTAGHGSLRPA